MKAKLTITIGSNAGLPRAASKLIRCKLFTVLLILFITPLCTLAQSTVSGTVKDANSQPIPGVSVRLKGTSVGSTTDALGKYVLNVPNLNGTLTFTIVGFTAQELAIGGKPTVNVILQESSSELEDVVVVGFGKQKRTDMIGSVSSIKPSELKIPSSNLTTALVGKASGVIGFQRSGEPGADNAEFFIRGVTTFGYKVDPLILIDNVEVTTTDLARLQVDDIASFSIMKDATSTAIYGARGANGVILITTKEGVEGPASLSFRFENSVSAPTSEVEVADPVTYMKMHNEAFLTRNPLAPLEYQLKQIEGTVANGDPLLYPVVNWQEDLIKDYTTNQRVNLNVNGGGKIARYFVSGALNQDNGILNVPGLNDFNNNINLKTYSLRSNVNVNLTGSTELLVRLNGSFDDYNGPIDGGTKVYRDIMRSNPVRFLPYYEPGGNYQFLNHIMFGNYRYGNSLYLNPYANMARGYRDYSRSNMLAQLELRQDLKFVTEGLNFRIMANTSRNSFFEISRQYNPFYYQAMENVSTKEMLYVPLNENTGTEYLDYREDEADRQVSSVFYLESALNYSKQFNQKHSVSGLLVGTVRNKLDGNTGSLQQSLPYRNIGLAGRFTYSYDNRYFTEFNFGYNGSERFHDSKRFGFFPSAGLAWTVSNEKFFASLKKVVNNLRIRGTYGLVGNDAIGSADDRFYYLSEINMNAPDRASSFGLNRSYTRNGILINRYSNTDITWETAYKSNVALELGLFNKFTLVADIFRENRKNIFMARAFVPAQMGLAADIAANVGQARGEGIDLSAEYNGNFSNGIWLQMMGNFTFARSKYLAYEEPDYSATPWLSRVGKPVSGTLGYIAERLFIDDAEVQNSPEQTFGVVQGGDIKYKDLNGDGRITTLDRMFIGSPTVPEINYGAGFSLGGIKGFDFSIFFQGLAKESFMINNSATAPFNRYVYNGESFGADEIIQNQVLKAYADSYWSEEHKDLYALWPRLSTTPMPNNTQTSTWFLRDGAFLRLKQAEIGYVIPGKLTKRWYMQKARIYVNGTNLHIWSRFKDWDVEMAGNGLGYPLQKVFNLGIQVSI